MTYYYNRYI